MRCALCGLGLLVLATGVFAGGTEVVPVREAENGGGVLLRYGAQRVLVVRGTPREMGLQHGRLLRQEVREDVAALLDWAVRRQGQPRESLAAIWAQVEPFVPARYREEMAGLAEGAGVPLADLQLVHAVPVRFHCTGTAALPAVTKDGKLYHTRSLDYSLDIEAGKSLQDNAILHVAVPEGGLPHAMVGWAGFLGCVTGLNARGVSVGEMGSRSRDESYDGVPMIFLLREVLWRAADLGEAKAIWTAGPRTCGYNFIFCDPGGACAVECTHTAIRFFAPGDEAENRAPHYAIEGVLRRCNHFVDPELAATQREAYDPRKSAPSSWLGYEAQGRLLAGKLGRIDAETMLSVLRGYPATHPCLHQALMCPTDRAIWVAQATDPRQDPLPGAQNQPFYRYDLLPLVEGHPAPALRFSTDRSVSKTVESGRVRETRSIEGFFAHEPTEFAWRMETLRSLGPVTIHHLSFPSPGPSRYLENLTVHGEYYRPAGEGPFPAVIVLHILDGRFYVARLVANALAQKGVAALFIQLPYYGDRRPAGKIDLEAVDLPDVVDAVRQGVRDVRRGAAWLRARREVDPERVGIVGVSLGAFMAELAAGADGGFDRCAFVLGGGSIADAVWSGSRDTRKIAALLEERGWPRAKAAPLLAPLEPIGLAAGVRREGVLMINCRADEVVPPASTERYWEALGRPPIVWYDGGHYALKDHVFEVLEKITGHFAAAPAKAAQADGR